jgi:nitrate/TMAO reductase-like tetraheme cytochrome c subunit
MVVGVVVGGITVYASRSQSQTPAAAALMERKLESAKSVLEGVVTANYDLLSREAQRLRLLSQETDWNVLQTDDYIRFSHDFRNATDQLRRAAEAKNLDAATVGYIKLTMTCVDCHQHVRDVRAGGRR